MCAFIVQCARSERAGHGTVHGLCIRAALVNWAARYAEGIERVLCRSIYIALVTLAPGEILCVFVCGGAATARELPGRPVAWPHATRRHKRNCFNKSNMQTKLVWRYLLVAGAC